jgi:hypothetical protein
MRFGNYVITLIGLLAAAAVLFFVVRLIPSPTLHFPAQEEIKGKQVITKPSVSSSPATETKPVPPPVTHLPTPKAVKAIYMTSYVAGDKKWRESLIKTIETTELNSIIIDIKDYTGQIAFPVSDRLTNLKTLATVDNRIPDLQAFLADLHKRGIYTIARIATFQDPALVKKRPDLAVKQNIDRTKVWADRKGQTWVDAGASEAWDYFIAIGVEAYSIGFDEVNYDYIRFPSDGDMKNIYFPFSEGKKKADVMKSFFTYLDEKLSPVHVVTSADLFGMTTTNSDDLNIGQVLEPALEHFDYVAPMVYPSHYPTNFMGFKNPAEKPYEVIKYSMDKAVARASTSPGQLRPWLQDFSLGAIYDAAKVKAQIQAVYDSGLTSWMLWNASNKYTLGALNVEP